MKQQLNISLVLRSFAQLKEELLKPLVPEQAEKSHSSAMLFVVCRADRPRGIIHTKLAQMERKSETSFSYQSERSTFGGGLIRLQSKIGLVISGTGNLIFDRKIRF